MSAIEVLSDIVTTKLPSFDFRYCLVNEKKFPFKIDNTMAKINKEEDFVKLEELFLCTTLNSYAGIGISVQASKVCAIDVDKCFSKPFDFSSADDRAKDIFLRFKDIAYIEFSFSGKGMRVLFRSALIENYSDKYYIKNDKLQVEYYQPSHSYRYVTVTGRVIQNLGLESDKINDALYSFLEDYMKKPVKKEREIKTQAIENRPIETLMTLVKLHYFKDNTFQNLWFDRAPGSGSNESERDYHLVAYLYENITQDKDMIKQIFESSPFFKSKDWKHVNKWHQQDGRYFNYLYDTIQRVKK